MQMRSLSVAVLTFSLLATNQAQAAEKALDRAFPVAAGGRLNVSLGGGHIDVTGTDASQVVVRMKATGSEEELRRLSWSAEKDAAGVTVVSKRDGGDQWFGWGNEVKLTATIEVPRQYNVELATSGGHIELKNLIGNASGGTSGGRLTIDSVQGDVKMRTSGGRISVRTIQGAVDVHTSGGAIEAVDIKGGLRAHTSGGSIRVQDVSGAVDVNTSGGSIDVDLHGDNQGVVARTSGGSINLAVPSTIRASINASSSGGRVSSDLELAAAQSTKNTLRGTINGGGPEITARTSGGSVRLTRRD